jgi:hypothetical protein
LDPRPIALGTIKNLRDNDVSSQGDTKMPSFKATVLSDIDLDGSKILTLYRIRERDPVELLVTAATVEGNDDVSTPAGTCLVAAVLASFPYDTVAPFTVRSRVKVSWVDDVSGELLGLSLQAL